MDGRKDSYLGTNKRISERTKLASFAGTVPDGQQLKGDDKHVKAHPRERLLKLSKKYPERFARDSGSDAKVRGDFRR